MTDFGRKTERELIQEWEALRSSLRQILEVAEKRGSGMTDDEHGRFDNLTAKAKSKRQEISDERARRAAELETSVADLYPEEAGRSALNPRALMEPLGSERAVPGVEGGTTMFRSADGGLVPALRAEQRLSNLVSVRDLPSGVERDEVRFGDALVGKLTADWRGREAEERLMSTSSDVGGGFAVPSVLSNQLVDAARSEMVLGRAGCLTVPMETSSMTFAKVTGDASVGWRQEGQPLEETGLTFGATTLTAQSCGGFLKVTEELLRDAPNAGDLIQSALSAVLARALDRAGLMGEGAAGEPCGLKNCEGIEEIDVDTDETLRDYPSYRSFGRARQLVLENDGPGDLSLIVAPATVGYLDALTDGTGNPLQPPASWKHINMLPTTAIPTDLGVGEDRTECYLGNFPDLVMGVRDEIRVEASREAADDSSSAFKNLEVWIRVWARVDYACLRPAWFVRLWNMKRSLTAVE